MVDDPSPAVDERAVAPWLHHTPGMSTSHSSTSSSSVLPTLALDELDRVHGGYGAKLESAMDRARGLGLRITSTTGGRHTPTSYHYRGRAFDAAGSASSMRQFYSEMSRTNPTELFYDPMGGMKHGRNIGAIGGHGDHVHVAY